MGIRNPKRGKSFVAWKPIKKCERCKKTVRKGSYYAQTYNHKGYPKQELCLKCANKEHTYLRIKNR